MSEITGAFNAAAAGPSGEASAAGSGPMPSTPGGSGAATAESSHTSSGSSSTFHNANTDGTNIEKFNAASELIASEASNDNHSSDQEPGSTIASAKAEFAILERAKLKPSLRLNLKPPAQVKNAVDLKAERQRVARASALKAYVEFRMKNEAQDTGCSQGEELEYCL